jgi:hypothetical protein
LVTGHTARVTAVTPEAVMLTARAVLDATNLARFVLLPAASGGQ